MSKLLILVPRPLPHLAATQEYLENQGFATLPLALSMPQATESKVPAQATALLLTSQLAVQAYLPNLPAYCVGEKTATAATRMGLKVAYSGYGNAADLGRAVLSLKVPPQVFVHPHGNNAQLGWHKMLEQQGHTVLPVEAYRSHAVAELTADFQQQSRQHQPTHTLLFSAGSANHLASLLKHANMEPTSTAVALSAAVAQAARVFWPHVVVARAPTLAAMVQALNKDIKP